MALDLTNRKTGEALARLPLPSNNSLRDLFKGVDRVVIKNGGVYEETAIKDEIALTISTPEAILAFISLLEIEENYPSFYCMCSGDYAIELLAGDKLITTIGLHHGVSIRYNHWRSDASLSKQEPLLNFLNTLGFADPLHKWLADKERSRPDKIAKQEWIYIAPKCFKKYVDKVGNEPIDIDNLQAALSLEIPDENEQVIRLLRVFGKSFYPGSESPAYETLPMLLLDTRKLTVIIQTYLNSDRNYKTRRGLARYLFGLKKPRLKLKQIPFEVLDDLEKFVVSIADEWGIRKITQWRQTKKLMEK